MGLYSRKACYGYQKNSTPRYYERYTINHPVGIQVFAERWTYSNVTTIGQGTPPPLKGTFAIATHASGASHRGTRQMDYWYHSLYHKLVGWMWPWTLSLDYHYRKDSMPFAPSSVAFRKSAIMYLATGVTGVPPPRNSYGSYCGICTGFMAFLALSCPTEALNSYRPYGRVFANDSVFEPDSQQPSTLRRTDRPKALDVEIRFFLLEVIMTTNLTIPMGTWATIATAMGDGYTAEGCR